MPSNKPPVTSNDDEYPLIGFNHNIQRRCKRIKRNGVRCKKYAAAGFAVCCMHGAGRVNSAIRQIKYGFKSKQLQEAFEKLAADPDRLDLTEELALSRVCLQAAVGKLETLSPNASSAIISLTETIASVAQSMSKIEKDIKCTINAEQLRVIADQFIMVVVRHVKDEELLAKIQDDLEKVALPNDKSIYIDTSNQ